MAISYFFEKEDEMKGKKFSERYNIKWIILISIWTFIMAAVFTIVSDKLVENLNVSMSFIVLILIILIGIIFDIIGIAVTTGGEQTFHAMAANRVKEARHAIKLVRNAAQVSNFCNDVIGDISGIISGAISTNIVFNIIKTNKNLNGAVLSIIVTSLVASLTVGGKAFGKDVAMNFNEEIIFFISKFLYFLDENFGIKLLKDKKDKKEKENKKQIKKENRKIKKLTNKDKDEE